MAVRSLNFFELHAGKVFLTVVAVIALLLAWFYVFGETVTVQVGERQLTLAEIHEQLTTQSLQLARKIDKIAPPVTPPIAAPAGLDKFYPSAPPQLASQVFVDVGLVTPGKAGSIRFEQNVLLPTERLKPAARPLPPTSGQGVARFAAADPTKPPQEKQVRWVVVYTQIPFDSIRDFLKVLRQRGGPDAVPPEIPLLLEIRLQRAAVDDQGRIIGEPVLVERFSRAPPTEAWRKYPFPGTTDAKKLQEWVGVMAEFKRWLAGVQPDLYRPKMYELATGDVFKVPGLIAEEAKWRQSRMGPTTAPGGEFTPGESGPPAPPAGGMSPAGSPAAGMAPAGQPAAGPGLAGPADVMPPPDPGRDDMIGIYAIDETVEPNQRCVYRVQYSILNPLLNSPILKESDRYKVALETAWSPWSDPVQTERDMYYYLTAASELGEGGVKMAVFRFTMGWWFAKTYAMPIGEPIGGTSKERVMKKSDLVDVNFSTGLVPVDIRVNEPVIVRQPGISPDSPPVLSSASTTEVVLMDGQGRLIVRNIRQDEAGLQRMRDKLAEQDKLKNLPTPGPGMTPGMPAGGPGMTPGMTPGGPGMPPGLPAGGPGMPAGGPAVGPQGYPIPPPGNPPSGFVPK